MKITIYGAGYVGLVSGSCLADVGNEVLCVDVNAERVAALNEGEIPIFEPGLSGVIKRNRREWSLAFHDRCRRSGGARRVAIRGGGHAAGGGWLGGFEIRARSRPHDWAAHDGTFVWWSTNPPCPWAPLIK